MKVFKNATICLVVLGLAILLSASIPLKTLAQHHDTVRKIEFTSMTRGYAETVTITMDSVTVSQSNRGAVKQYKRKITKQEWAKILTSLKSVAYDTIPLLKSPTMRRNSDAALHSNIAITTDAEKRWSHGFDDENPNRVLAPLMRTIHTLKKSTAR